MADSSSFLTLSNRLSSSFANSLLGQYPRPLGTPNAAGNLSSTGGRGNGQNVDRICQSNGLALRNQVDELPSNTLIYGKRLT
jgi:hypothetical protein